MQCEFFLQYKLNTLIEFVTQRHTKWNIVKHNQQIRQPLVSYEWNNCPSNKNTLNLKFRNTEKMTRKLQLNKKKSNFNVPITFKTFKCSFKFIICEVQTLEKADSLRSCAMSIKQLWIFPVLWRKK